MLNSDEMRFAIEDARTRHEAVVNLVNATDQQAIALLSLYVTLGLAVASGFIGSIVQPAIVPPDFAVPLFVATAGLVAGAFMCFKTVETSKINLPGRQADFWIWADTGTDVTQEYAYRKYLENLASKQALNNDLNARTAARLALARKIGVFTPFLASVAAVIVAVWRAF